MVAGFPLGPVLEGAGLNITVMSYRGVLNWGLMACRETVAGADEIAAAIPVALDELLVAAGLPRGAVVGIAPGHRSDHDLDDGKASDSSGSESASKSSSPKSGSSKGRTPKSQFAKTQAANARTENAQTEKSETAEADPVVAVMGENTEPEHVGSDLGTSHHVEQDAAEPKREWLGGQAGVDTVADLLDESGPVRVPAHADPNEGSVHDQNSPGNSNGSG